MTKDFPREKSWQRIGDTYLSIILKPAQYFFQHMSKAMSLSAPPDFIDEYQRERLKKVVKECCKIPYWREKFQQANVDTNKIETLEDLIGVETTRDEVEKNWKKMMHPGSFYIKFKTSGTTLNPLPVPASISHLVSILPVIASRCKESMGITEKDTVLVIFPTKAASQRLSTLGKALLGYNIKFADILNVDEQLRKVKDADIVIGYSTAITKLAQFMNTKHKRKVRKFITTSEPLPKVAEDFIKEKTGAQVQKTYGMIEALSLVGETCEKGNYHLFSDLFAIRFKNGEILLTSLDKRRKLPLINYHTGDYGKEVKCDCGITHKSFIVEEEARRRFNSERVLASISSLPEFYSGDVSPYFDFQEEFHGVGTQHPKRIFNLTVYATPKVNKDEIKSKLERILLYGDGKHLKPAEKTLFWLNMGLIEINVRVKQIDDLKKIVRVKNPRK